MEILEKNVKTVESFNKFSQIDFSKYDYLVTPIGFPTYQPSLCFIQAIKPSKILFVVTKESRELLNELFEQIEKWYQIKPAQYEIAEVKGIDTNAIYLAVKKFTVGKDKNKILVDVTAGKKSMTSALSLVAEYLNSDVGYVDQKKYDPKTSRPIYGTEYGVLLGKPFQQFGEMELQKVSAYLKRYDYQGSIKLLDKLKDQLNEVQKVRELRTGAKILKDWHDFKIKDAIDCLIDYSSEFIPSKIKSQLLKFGKAILNGDDSAIILNYYYSSFRYKENERYELATFLAYRALEKFAELNLKKYGINNSNVDISKLPTNALNLYYEYLVVIYGEKKAWVLKEYPRKLGLLESMITLAILGFNKFKNKDKTVNFFQNLESKLKYRNQSVFAHGDTFLSEFEFNKLNEIVENIIGEYKGQTKELFELSPLELKNLLMFQWFNNYIPSSQEKK